MTLGIEVINNRDIVISSPESGFSVTYRKDGDAPMLVAIDGVGRVVDQAKLKFWAQAWKAAHEKARAVGWLVPRQGVAGNLSSPIDCDSIASYDNLRTQGRTHPLLPQVMRGSAWAAFKNTDVECV